MIRLCLALILFAAPALAGTPAKVLRVLDGDSFIAEIEIAPWTGIVQRTPVRMAGIDSPEIRGKCPSEIAKAKEAKAQLTALVAKGGVELHDLAKDKYGRLLARVTVGGQDVAARMIALGLARAYGGGTRAGWC